MRLETQRAGIPQRWTHHIATALITAALAPPLVASLFVATTGCKDADKEAATHPTSAVEPLDDVSIQRAIDVALLSSPAIPYDSVQVHVDNGVVTLEGSVNNIYAEQRAVEIAQAIKGVQSVVERVKVKPTSRPDHEIARNIEKALKIDPTTKNYDVRVAVLDGHVTLRGTVKSWPERELAAQVAKSVRGVVSLDNDLLVNYGTSRADSEIATDIKAWLDNDLRFNASLVNVEVNDGIVHLSGTVGSALEKVLIASAARVNGVKRVDDGDVKVRRWAKDEMRRHTDPIRTDAEIRDSVRNALLHDPRVSAFHPSISVDRGAVTLTGTVSSLSAKRAAEDSARNTLGVLDVSNQLTVQPRVRRDDEAIKEDVMATLHWHTQLYRYDLNARVAHGRVYLSGTVPTTFYRTLAKRAIESIAGVLAIENDISVSPPPAAKSDWQIQHDLKQDLFWSPLVDSNSVHVTVNNGVATLSGTVGTMRALRAAHRKAQQAGATVVRNEIVAVTSKPKAAE